MTTDVKTRNREVIQEYLRLTRKKPPKSVPSTQRIRGRQARLRREIQHQIVARRDDIRGCAYAGAKGWCGPDQGHGARQPRPVGCGQYSWGTRRNYYGGQNGVDSFVGMQITSDFQEKDIVFGGDKKLDKMLDEINALFPLSRGISIMSECPIGLIGDDIEAVPRRRARNAARPSCRCVAKVSVGVAIPRPPHRQRHGARLGAGQGRSDP